MKTCIYSSLFLNGDDLLGGSRLERCVRYVEWYRKIQDDVGCRQFEFWDDKSGERELLEFSDRVGHMADINIFRYHEKLQYGGGLIYPYCWASLWHIRNLIDWGYQKIIMIDTDFLILSKRLAHFTRDTQTGWRTVWCPKYGFPEAAFHILTEDAFPLYLHYTSQPWERQVGKMMENVVPYTDVHMEFNVDRYGEGRVPQSPLFDGYAQTPPDLHLTYG